MLEPVVVSACLLGRRCRYDGRESVDPDLASRIAGREAIQVCPEEMGGLGTPREPADIRGGGGAEVLEGRARVIDRRGRDVTSAFVDGARRALEEAVRGGAGLAFLKSRSPSCGAMGVFTELLRRQGIPTVPCEGSRGQPSAS